MQFLDKIHTAFTATLRFDGTAIIDIISTSIILLTMDYSGYVEL